MNTETLIARLSSEVQTIKPVRTPGYWSVRLIAVLVIYGIGAQAFLGFRTDLAMQFTRPLFVLEIALLVSLLIVSCIASVLSMYPDAYQKPGLLTLPYGVFLLLLGVVVSQLFMPQDARMMILPDAFSMECAICIAAVALIPSALIFVLLRKGASVRQFQAGSFAVLAASAIGCLTLRLAEANDSLLHMAVGHYLPTLLFAALGAVIGKWLLKW